MAEVPKATMSFCRTDEEKVPTSQAESMTIWRGNLALGTFSSTLKVSPLEAISEIIFAQPSSRAKRSSLSLVNGGQLTSVIDVAGLGAQRCG